MIGNQHFPNCLTHQANKNKEISHFLQIPCIDSSQKQYSRAANQPDNLI